MNENKMNSLNEPMLKVQESGLEVEIPSEIAEEVEEQAMKESREYFQEQADALGDFLSRNKDRLAVLLDHVLNGIPVKAEDLRTEVDLSEHEDSDGFLDMMEQAFADCKSENGSLELFKSRMKELMNPEAQLTVARAKYELGQSWYHTTVKGKLRLEGIVEGVKASHQSEVPAE